MSAPLVPSPLDSVKRRRFSVYPAIRDAGPNNWLLRTGDWAEVQIVNAETGLKIWLPRQYVRGVSDASEMSPVVELTQQLRYSDGTLTGPAKRVIEIDPGLADPKARKLKRGRARKRAAVVGIRLESAPQPRVRRLARLGLWAIALCFLSAVAVAFARY